MVTLETSTNRIGSSFGFRDGDQCYFEIHADVNRFFWKDEGYYINVTIKESINSDIYLNNGSSLQTAENETQVSILTGNYFTYKAYNNSIYFTTQGDGDDPYVRIEVVLYKNYTLREIAN